jgi:hypothetical protein
MAQPRKKKKDDRVVVSGAYLTLLQEKAEMLDSLFQEGDSSEPMATIAPSDFKRVREFEKRFAKVDSIEEPLR